MSVPSQIPRQRSASGSSIPARERASSTKEYAVTPTQIAAMIRHFEPCAATAGMFLYAQGNSIVCCHHDTLTIERRFSSHPEDIQLLSVDNLSERGAGRLVVSYDVGRNAIVWDIITGTEVSRFTSFSNLTSVAWMRNGTVAFGNESGTIILFEPETSEHISFRTIDQIAVTALAPAADCRTFAIGYQNGSLLICNLQPRFTILHNLTTSRGPSPIVGLAWHASSARQRSDMLAVQTYDGDLRVWSVAKSFQSSDPAKVVRILKRTEDYIPGANWMGWSKNGRVIQYSEGETLSWDVRTKHVTYDSIPTLPAVKGLAVYGPGASLFTLGANNTVQQFDLNSPAVKVADVQHPANLLPPSPPVSIEEQEKAAAAAAAAAVPSDSANLTDSSAPNTSESEISIHLYDGVSESDEDHLSPFDRLIKAQARENADRSMNASPASSRSHISSQSSKSGQESSNRTPGRHAGSISNLTQGMSEVTYLSMGSSLKSSAVSALQQQRQSVGYTITNGSTSTGHSSRASRPSRLRNEIPRSPDDAKVHDLFKFTRSRLSDVPYRMPPPPNNSRLTNDDLRRQMLSTIFGWTKDIEELIYDEISRHPAGSANRILLSKWLGDLGIDIMAASSESMTSSDWMLLALSGIGSHASQHKIGRAYTQRLLESGDIHAAATIMIGMGDYNDAIEIYDSHHKYMEALLVACLFYPSVWERQSHLVKKWGEWAIKNGQRQLAIRCSMCTTKESTEPWTSPSAAQMNFPSIGSTLPDVLSPPLSPPSMSQRGPQRSIAKASSLRLITNFSEDSVSRAPFFSNEAGGATPIAAGVTPIMDSAVSPAVGSNTDVVTAFLRPSSRSTFNTPSSARSSAFSRQRLPSIGETPADSRRLRNALKEVADQNLPKPPAGAAEAARAASPKAMAIDDNNVSSVKKEDNFTVGMSLPRASTSSPLLRRKELPPPSPSPASMALFMEARARRNGSRDRIPNGLDLQIAPTDKNVVADLSTSEQSYTSSNRYHWPTRRRAPGSVSSSVTSTSSATGGRGHRYRTSEVVNPSKTLNEYISSLEAAKSRVRPTSRERRQRSRESSRHSKSTVSASTSTSGAPTPTPTPGRGEVSRGYTGNKSGGGGKRSPRSPVPMSPEDLINLSTPKNFSTDTAAPMEPQIAPLTVRKVSSRPNSRTSNRDQGSLSRSPERYAVSVEASRGRNSVRSGSEVRSPSSPLPFSSDTNPYYASEEEDDDYKKAVEDQENFRSRGSAGGRGRSSSSNRRKPSPGATDSRRPTPTANAGASSAAATTAVRKDRSLTGPPPAPSAIAVAAGVKAPTTAPPAVEDSTRRHTPSISNRGSMGDLKKLSTDERAQRKAAAARELEERRKSLARRPLAPPIMQPHELSPAMVMESGTGSHMRTPESFEFSMPDTFRPASDLPARSQSTEPGTTSKTRTRSMFAQRGPSIGLPATPKAMRLVLESSLGGTSAPPMPSNYSYKRSPTHSGSMSPPDSPEKKETAEVPVNAQPTETPAPQEATLTLLPSTVYQPPTRTDIPRSMSAPPQNMNYRKAGRAPKLIIPDSGSYTNAPVQMEVPSSAVDDTSFRHSRRPSVDDMIPPPPPPPPMLKELAHLITPPPPPPAPLPFGNGNSQPASYGGQATTTIEVVMDDGQVQPILTMSPAVRGNMSSIPPPPPPPPSAPPSTGAENNMSPSRSGHQRGRSSTDNSIAGRLSRATERMRSASRGRNASVSGRTKSPEMTFAPYESIPFPATSSSEMTYAPYESVPQHLGYAARTSPPNQQQMFPGPGQQLQQFRTGLHESEMI